MKKTTLFMIVALMFSCNNQTEEKKEISETPEVKKVEKTVKPSQIGRENYAVVWKWKTTDKQLIEDNTIDFSNEMNNLWKQNIIVDAYYNSEAKIDKFEHFPNISFFMRAKSMENAKAILNNLILVKKGIAEYSIYHVGLRWLDRKTEVIRKRGLTHSYVAVWTTKTKEDNFKELIEQNAQDQSTAIVNLWKKGIIENAYFDIEGASKGQNSITDFVFFVNANSEKEAKEICDNLPFSKKNIASYILKPVGTFWLGEHK